MKGIRLPSRFHWAFYVALSGVLLNAAFGRSALGDLDTAVFFVLALAVCALAVVVIVYLIRHRSWSNALHTGAALVALVAVYLARPAIDSAAHEWRRRAGLPALDAVVRRVLGDERLCGSFGPESAQFRESLRDLDYVDCSVTNDFVACREGGVLDDSWGVLWVREGRPVPEPGSESAGAATAGPFGATLGSLRPISGRWYAYETY